MKTCTICNTEKMLNEFLRDKHAKGGYRNQCKVCLRDRNKGVWEKRKEGYNKAMRKFRNTWKGVTQTSLTAAKCRSKVGGIAFNLTLDYLRNLAEEQGFLCALTGDQMIPKGGWDAPSLDRKVPHLGYTMGNVQWVTKRANASKSNLTNEQFLELRKKCLERSETIRKEYTSSEVEAPNT